MLRPIDHLDIAAEPAVSAGVMLRVEREDSTKTDHHVIDIGAACANGHRVDLFQRGYLAITLAKVLAALVSPTAPHPQDETALPPRRRRRSSP